MQHDTVLHTTLKSFTLSRIRHRNCVAPATHWIHYFSRCHVQSYPQTSGVCATSKHACELVMDILKALCNRVGHGLDPSMDWIGLDWIGSDDCNPLFFFIYIFSLLTTDKRCRCNTIMCILADFNRL